MTEPSKIIPDDLDQALADAQSALAAERAERGRRKLDGKPYDARRILSLESQIDSLQHAIGEKVRRERAADAEAQESLRRELTGRLREADAARLAAIADMQRVTRAFGEALSAVMATTGETRRLIRALNLVVPLAISEHAVERRLSNLIGRMLAEITGQPRFGDLRWHIGAGASRDWADDERRAGGVKSLLRESKNVANGNGVDRGFGAEDVRYLA